MKFYDDNHPAMHITSNLVCHKKINHIDIDFVREKKSNKIITLLVLTIIW